MRRACEILEKRNKIVARTLIIPAEVGMRRTS
jgi:hypothetical protein